MCLHQDGFAQLNRLREDLKDRVRIQFIDAYGMAEAGVDGGGLFKDFMENLVKEGFDPQNGLFLATSDNRLYPNPNAQLATSDAILSFEFLGRMVGKALYEASLLSCRSKFRDEAHKWSEESLVRLGNHSWAVTVGL